ncbi:MAG: hypothetical protein KDC98_15760 [Planctomycetes bacterium]|nr:hypothetical protein [Planctomycetota bacterium]
MTAAFGLPLVSGLVGQELAMQVAVFSPTANSVGLAWSKGLAAHIGPMPTATSMVSSISQFGITYQFAAPVQAGRFVNGDWFVIGPARITAMTPPCTTVSGRVLNGAMINPDPSTQDHGYDSGLYGSGNGHLYLPALNVALGLSASIPITLQPNQCLIKVISNTDPAFVPQIRTCSVLTCLAVVPAGGSFRPPYAGPDHEVRYDTSHLDWNVLSALQPAAGMPVIATEEAQFQRPWLDHSPGWPSRYMHPVENMPDYGRDFSAAYNQATLLCNLALTRAERRTLLIRLVQIGIDFWGNVKNGCYWEGVGGHGSGRKWPILFAGRLLHDADMLNVGHTHRSYRNQDGSFEIHFGEDGQTFYVEQTGANQWNWGYGGYTQQHVGLPEFGFSHVHWPLSDHEPWGQDPYRRCCTANAWIGGILCVHVMGLVQEWNHPALFDYMDRFTVQEPHGWTREWLPWTGRMWDQYRSSY